MRSGLLKERLTVVHLTTTKDDYGSVKKGWAEDKTVYWARKTYKDSGFGIKNDEAVYKSVVSFELRYTDAIKPYDRIKYNDYLYRIAGFEQYPSEGRLVLKCELLTEN